MFNVSKAEIPTFPYFTELSEVSSNSFALITKRHLPHASFNHTNVHAWDLNNNRQVSSLNGNLLLLRSDYETGEKFLCMLGTNNITDTLEQIRSFVVEHGISDELRLIPDEGIDEFLELGLQIWEDPDNHEYIYSLSDLGQRAGGKLHKKNQASRNFERLYPHVIFKQYDARDAEFQKHAIGIFKRWEQRKFACDKECDVTDEETALRRLLQSPNANNLVVSCLYDADTMIGLSIDELVHDNYVIGHFVKADTTYKGVYEFLNEKTARHLLSLGAKFWNWQQDLGIEGLRQLKQSYHPTHILKKHRVKVNTQ